MIKELILVVATVYNACPNQGFGDGTITADGSKIITGNERWIAVSRDLIGYVNFGDTILLNDKHYIVKDLMNKRYTKRVDILQPKNKRIFKKDSVIFKKK